MTAWVSSELRAVNAEPRLVTLAVTMAVVLSIVTTYAGPVQPGQTGGAAARLGSPAPAFAVLLLDGQPVKLADLRGRIVVLNFWATWCPPCRAEMPELDALARERPDVTVLAVDVQEDAAQVEGFRAELQLSLPIALDAQGHAWATYQSRGFPTTYLIDRDGTIRDVQGGPAHTGPAEDKAGALPVRPDPLAWSVPWVGFVLHTDALFALAGILVGMAALRVAARDHGLSVPAYADLLSIAVWALVGGRAWYAAVEWQFFLRYPLALFSVQDGGLAVPGLLLGGLWGLRGLAATGALAWTALPLLLAPALAAGRAVQVAGCVVTECMVGASANVPWAAPQDSARHPIALYAVLLLAAAWFVASRASSGSRRWLGIGAYLGAELGGLTVAALLTAARA